VALLGEARVTRYTAAGVMPAAECATPAEAALVAVHHRTEAAAPPETAALVHWLNSAHPEYWAHIGAALGAETRRASAASAHDAYTGRLASPALVAQAAAMLGPERTWSASQFGELGTCGYRFFARRLVGLEPIEPIEDGADARAVGSVVHGILEAVYRVVQARGLRIAPEHAHEARAIAAEICDRMLADAPDTYHFRAALWADDSAVLRRRILRAVHADFTGTLWSSRSNGLQPPEGPRTVEALEADFHVGLDAGRAGRLRVRGRFDRIDRVNAERPSWLIVDYKTGSRRILPAETRSGRNYQMLVYLWAARQRFGQPDAARLRGEYWHITGDVKAAGKLSFAEEQDVLDDGLAALGEQVARARTGDFSAEANGREDGRCSRHCAYAQLCRASILAPRE
jgi:ATP-dependent helicase/nuclease subunit B